MILQALALADLKAGKPSMGQFISLAWSILNIAHTFVDVNFTMDTSESYRVLHPKIYGDDARRAFFVDAWLRAPRAR